MTAAWAEAGEDGLVSGDLAKLQGKWETQAGASRELRVTLEFTGKQAHVVIHTPQGLKIKARGEIRIDESTSPKRVDWVGFSAGDFQAIPEIQGVYKLEGEALILCNGGFNGARPVDFAPGDGPLADVVAFRRSEPPRVADSNRP
ncbi:TIGR03067 domain-containing protein [Paludisphaera rhizosphaerae]|uniref:TIGR03067 domain-containing protein n=1 Tax=Paludisphaera rhizosphaerae TaxID=2711216 RepID=UPI0013EE14A5|nr:TIGR03067 domain-containing protein [Paludisphaera rhizosphaerae]